MVRLLEDKDEKRRVVRKILEALPDWFGIEESREQYIRESADQIMLVAEDEDRPELEGEKDSKAVGFLCLKQTGNATVELAVMGVLVEYHRKGIGRELFKEAKRIAQEKGYSFMQVKTVEMGHYDDYDATNRFYISLGFQEFEVFPLLWDEANPCQIYVMSLK